ncbi:adenine phosphoribosyltransferase [Synechococcus elongatus PCC 6301]|nr:adenine phosphoribosyltransferase [Synechococcus elongatus PCC 6301]
MDLKTLIREIPDFPKPGILFRDYTTVLKDPQGWRYSIDRLTELIKPLEPTAIVGIESRGFILGAPLAYQLGLGFVPVRKPGKLPADTHSVEYELEYGSDRLEIHQDALAPGDRVVVVDDLDCHGRDCQCYRHVDRSLQRDLGRLCLCDRAGRAEWPRSSLA